MRPGEFTCPGETPPGPCVDHGKQGNVEGYSLKWCGTRGHGRHRIAFENRYGWSPPVVLHLCDNPRCVNPDHLRGGTHADNTADKRRKGRCPASQPSLQKLSNEDVRAIRARYVRRCPEHGAVAMARQYGVSDAAIGCIVRRKTYKDVE